jgi:DNA-binding NtrC family response regulator
LLVDDEDLVRRALARRLRQTGINVFEAANGKDAVRLYQERRANLVVLDLDMPELDGEQTHQQLITFDPKVQVAYITGYVEPSREQQLRNLGAIAILEKPCPLDALLSVVSACAPRCRIDETKDADDTPTLT